MKGNRIPRAVVTRRGAERWKQGHPWIYASDVPAGPAEPGLVQVRDERGKFLGQALFSPRSEIRLRLIERSQRPVDGGWWEERLQRALARRTGIEATGYRVVHAEGDGLPALIVDRYDRWIVGQILSAALEAVREPILTALRKVLNPEGILLRNDVPARRREGLPEAVELAYGSVPEEIEIREQGIRYLAAPWSGQKTGAFLDQRANRIRAGELAVAGGRGLDCFAYHGSFALHLASRSERVLALDTSAEALERGARNAALNGFNNIEWAGADAFEMMRKLERAGDRFDTIVVDPPAFAKSKGAVAGALRGYKEINLRAMRLVAPGGVLVSASCSFHVHRAEFMGAIAAAARDSGRAFTIVEHLGQGPDHPESVTIPETAYLKGVILRAGD